MSKLPDDLSTSVMFTTDTGELARQLENIFEIITDAHNSQINSEENYQPITAVFTQVRPEYTGIGILMIMPLRDGYPGLIAACCKPMKGTDGIFNILCQQPGTGSQQYNLQWLANQTLQAKVSTGSNFNVRVLWIGT